MTTATRSGRALPWAALPIGLGVGLVALTAATLAGVILGYSALPLSTAIDAIFDFDAASFDHVVVREIRFPRMIAAVLIGAALAASGAIMQGVTANPLADPGILGITAGASLAVVLGVSVLGLQTLEAFAGLAMIGAAVAAFVVYGLASLGPGGATPVKLALVGIILGAFSSAITTATLLLDDQALDRIRYWTVGSLAGRDWEMIGLMAPLVGAGLAGALLLGRQITTMSIGNDVAKGLGQNTARVQMAAAGLVIVMTGAAVAIAGPVGFVGLVAPHMVRPLCGVDYRWVIPYSAVLGAVLVVVADIASRVVLRPAEVPIGVMLALVGVPFFIYLARWRAR